MEKIKKNPVLMGILSAVGCAVLLLIVEFVLSLIKNRTFSEQINSSTYIIILLIAGPISSGLAAYKRAAEKLEEKNKKQQDN